MLLEKNYQFGARRDLRMTKCCLCFKRSCMIIMPPIHSIGNLFTLQEFLQDNHISIYSTRIVCVYSCLIGHINPQRGPLGRGRKSSFYLWNLSGT